MCVVNRLRAPLAGTLDPATGCAAIELRLGAGVFTSHDLARPCPLCAGDPVPNDGRKQGRCAGGAAPDAPCDGEGVSALFGTTSTDCPPDPARGLGELVIDLEPLTTGTSRRTAESPCKDGPPGEDVRCVCPGESLPNACDGGACAASERCEVGPLDGRCSGAPFRSCRIGATSDDCAAASPAAGVCTGDVRRCFTDAIEATGACDPRTPTWVAVSCLPATRAPALNAVAGLPGPGRLVLPLERVDAPRAAPRAKTRGAK